MADFKFKEIDFDEDAVLRGQGADPDVIRTRSPKLVEISKQALQKGRQYLEPKVIYEKINVASFRHEILELENGKRLSGPLIAEHLYSADYVVLIMCTIGDSLEEYTSKVIKKEISLGLALDGVGSAAVEALANSVCNYFEREAAQDGYQSSIPLSPGMIGWEVNEGQPEIFEILDNTEINVHLNPNYIMTPRKTLTMVMGFGKEMKKSGKTCDYCMMAETCKYRDHYETAT